MPQFAYPLLGSGLPLEPFYQTLIPLVLGLVVLKVLFACLRKKLVPKIKGAVGEWQVNAALFRRLNPEEYEVLDNLLLPDGRGGLTQIDHVVLSPFGVFVIETKNWNCWIFGSEKNREWTLSYRGGAKKRTMNPLAQNATHVRAICEMLDVRSEHAHNLVFISEASVLKTGPVPGVFQNGLVDHISSFRLAVFHPHWPRQAAAKLRQACQSHDKQSVRLHLEQVKSKKMSG